MKIKYVLLSALLLFVAAVALLPSEKAKSKPFHSANEIARFKQHLRAPIDSGEFFLTASNCRGCHGFDPMGEANVNENGDDVNLFDDWETSMMGLSAVDPLWRAKVSHESLINPDHAESLQTTCTSCHAPMGHYTAFYKGQSHYTIADLQADSLGRDGVSCVSCHSIGPDVGSTFSGVIPYDTTKVLYGPFPGPMIGPMILYTGMTPQHSAHVSESRFCSPCHTLQVQTVDLDGNYTGGTSVEQATYHEWLNSSFPSQNKNCQSCHMPKIDDPVKIANGYTGLPGRSPFNLHSFGGANVFMVELIKQNKNALGVTAADAQFDSTIAATLKLLQQQTLDIDISKDELQNDTAQFTVTLVNKAGHKFPSGYPSRRAVLQFVALKENGDTLFASGMFNDDFFVKGEDASFEPHYNTINSSTKPLIYEMVMGDVNGNRTTVLERAAEQLKDNRIPPAGFTSTHYSYDTVKVVGTGGDPNFNKNGSVEGTGSDKVQYRVALNGYTGKVNVHTSVQYQSVPPKWLDEMFAHNSAEIDSFRNMYNAADKTPVQIAFDSLQNVSWTDVQSISHQPVLRVTPNPTTNGVVTFEATNGALIESVEVVNGAGEKAAVQTKRLGVKMQIQLPPVAGVYYARVRVQNKLQTVKLLRL
ncbi:MAG TPA: T9SS type A sorting domain-containing protein [Chitinophagales bacterium]|nr:T9SS type A sorting domain-containing protein [Chitinophagales bacterium]